MKPDAMTDHPHRLIARRADGEVGTRAEEAALDAHLADCPECRSTLDDQAAVSAVLRSRPAEPVSSAFASRVASRLDELTGWLGVADFRTWTLRLAPIAAMLALTALLTARAFSSEQSVVTLEEWARPQAQASSGAAVLWQQNVSADAALETLLTGRTPTGEASDVR
jgi:anti-sigma factor RsiW